MTCNTYYFFVPWQVFFHAEFEPEFDALDPEVQDELLAHANLLKEFGRRLKRPTATQFTDQSTTT
jgi:hypothetical protein